MNRDALPPLHIVLALAVVAVWGLNFVVVKVALTELPPLTLAALRFTVALLPAAFIKRPAVPWRNLVTYGLLIGVGQFGALFIALHGMISPGLASLVAQMQVFFTIGLAMRVTGERIRGFQLAALGVAAAGLAWLMSHASAADLTPLGLVLTLISAASWAGGNIVARATPGVNMLAFVVWGSLFSAPPLFALALACEGWPTVSHAIAHASAGAWAAVVWQALGNTLFGYGAWAWLLARHPAAAISPLSLLIPVVAMGASWLLLGEPLAGWKLVAAALVLSSLAINMLWPMLARRAAAAA